LQKNREVKNMSQNNLIPLHLLPCGEKGKIKKLTCTGTLKRRMMDLGLIRDTIIHSLRKSPSGDPTAYEIRGSVIALRTEDAAKILIEML